LKDKIPRFYFPEGNASQEAIEAGDKVINEVFTKDIAVEEFIKITVDLLGFPKMFNSVLFNKIAQGDNKISKKQFIK